MSVNGPFEKVHPWLFFFLPAWLYRKCVWNSVLQIVRLCCWNTTLRFRCCFSFYLCEGFSWPFKNGPDAAFENRQLTPPKKTHLTTFNKKKQHFYQIVKKKKGSLLKSCLLVYIPKCDVLKRCDLMFVICVNKWLDNISNHVANYVNNTNDNGLDGFSLYWAFLWDTQKANLETMSGCNRSMLLIGEAIQRTWELIGVTTCQLSSLKTNKKKKP